MNTLEMIMMKQRNWANANFPSKISPSFSCYQDNLFELLQNDAKAEYENGAGKELTGNMKSFQSSSALVCNFFHYWRYHDMNPLLQVLNLLSPYDKIVFERSYCKPKGILGIKPHVDVEITGVGLTPIAIESKFTETLSPKSYSAEKPPFAKVYLKNSKVWDSLKSCYQLVNSIDCKEQQFRYFDAPQLLKHILGLKTEYGNKSFKLIYLWYKVDCSESLEHESEMEIFKTFIRDEVDFQSFTYQELFNQLQNICNGHKAYFEYMKNRYFNKEYDLIL